MRVGKIYAAIIVLFTIVSIVASGQTRNDLLSQLFKERKELYFKFEINTPKELMSLTHLISLDNVKGTTVFAYANQKEFSDFLDLGYSYEPLTPPSMLIIPEMRESVTVKGITDWDFYPTYQAYVDMMYQFQTRLP